MTAQLLLRSLTVEQNANVLVLNGGKRQRSFRSVVKNVQYLFGLRFKSTAPVSYAALRRVSQKGPSEDTGSRGSRCKCG